MMRQQKLYTTAIVAILTLMLSGCSGGGFSGGPFSGGSLFGGGPRADLDPAALERRQAAIERNKPKVEKRSTIWELFERPEDPNTSVKVSKYIWAASLDVLSFLPVQSADPFTGVIVTGFGTPPGGGRAYRATIFVNDPALDARSLKVALQTRSGPASIATVRAVEDAILTRARQLRIGDSRL
ncbi:MAG: DUF3576 domain-containing protein [Marinosulfonomonas sp.]|nr:DUF3576 domain-containing protein [Marinosulfonomonas sp.]